MRDVEDPRPWLFAGLNGRRFLVRLVAEEEGVFSGADWLEACARDLGLEGCVLLADGAEVHPGAVVAEFSGTALEIARGEEQLLGVIGKPSGIATAARRAVRAADGRARVVAGAWKKMPLTLKEMVRHAVRVGGMGTRICEDPFIYLDKNFVRMLGGLEQAVRAAKALEGRVVVVQVKGEWGPVADEVLRVAEVGAGIVMVDTGNLADLVSARRILESRPGPRPLLAFGGGVRIESIPGVCDAGADIIDVGRAVVDAPLLGFRMDVAGPEPARGLGIGGRVV